MSAFITFETNGDVRVEAPNYAQLEPFCRLLAMADIQFSVRTGRAPQLVFEQPLEPILDHLTLVLVLLRLARNPEHPDTSLEDANERASRMLDSIGWG